ncbi:MAG: thermonuclease family protein [Planctomycetes bacterium]|nr:thermonuclease family protein [Planctomycetota bacterium]
MGRSFQKGIRVGPGWVSFAGSGVGDSGGGKGVGVSVGPPKTLVHDGGRMSSGGKIVAGGCGLLSFLMFGGLFFICFGVFSRLEPSPVAERPPIEPPAEPLPLTVPEPVQPAAVEAQPQAPQPERGQPALPNPEPPAEPLTLPEFTLEPEPKLEPEREPQPEPKPLAPPPTTYRKWNGGGKLEIEAEFVSMAMGKVKLRKADGEEVTLPLEKLSETDRRWIEQEKTSSSIVHARLSRDSRILAGSVAGVADGDTITVSDKRKIEHTVRLQGIDAPEEGQAYSAPAKEALSEKILGKSVRVEWQKKDEQGRILGHAFLGVRWINKELVDEGWAWYRKQASDNEELAAAEKRASGKLLGLWAAADAIPPWEFQKRPEEAEASPGGEPSDEPSGDYWLTTSSGVRHNSSCRYYKKSNGSPCGPDAGTPCKVCGG